VPGDERGIAGAGFPSSLDFEFLHALPETKSYPMWNKGTMQSDVLRYDLCDCCRQSILADSDNGLYAVGGDQAKAGQAAVCSVRVLLLVRNSFS
jgi:hypothetical protein